MARKLNGVLLAFFGVVLAAVPALAHHSFTAEFDVEKPITLKGTISKVDWINPHVYLHVDVMDESGKIVPWEIGSWPPGLLHSAGVSKAKLEGAKDVTILAYRAKDGSKNLAYLRKITFADGHEFEFWNADPNQYK